MRALVLASAFLAAAASAAAGPLARAGAAAAIDSNLFVAVTTPAAPPAAAPAASPFTQDQFVAALARDLAAHFNLEGDLQLELLRPWTPPAVVARDWQIDVSDYPTAPASSLLLHGHVRADGAAAGDFTVVLHAALWRDAWVAREPLSNGAAFDPSLLDTRRTDFLRDREALPAAVGDRAFIFARAVAAGRLLTWRDLGRRPLVRKGEVVEVSAADGQLVLVMKALAMQNGAQGDAVLVRNLDSRKDFTAFVVDENRVQVRF